MCGNFDKPYIAPDKGVPIKERKCIFRTKNGKY